MDIYCAEPSCVDFEQESVAELSNFFEGVNELWTETHTERQSFIAAPDMELAVETEWLERTGRIAERFKIVCPHCGYDVTTGDLLGMGVRSMAHHSSGRQLPRSEVAIPEIVRLMDDATPVPAAFASPKRARAAERLSRVADSGVSRLALSSLDRILTM